MLSQFEFLSEFTLVGGSALAIYLNHRLSEDLDFFSWHPSLEVEKIKEALKTIRPETEYFSLSDKQIDCRIDGIKVTFFANNWPELKNSEILVGNSRIASLDLLAAMKVNTLFLRAKKRDYFDLFAIHSNGTSLERLFELSSSHFPGLTRKLFSTALVFIEDIQDESIDYLKPKQNVSLEKIQAHFKLALQKFKV